MTFRLAIVAIACLFLATSAGAQQVSGESHTVVVGALGGLSVGSSDAGPALGATLTIDLGHRLGLEGRGVFFGNAHGNEGFELSGALLVDLVEASRRTVPYIAVGGGLYHARLDLDDRRVFGGMTSEFPAGTWLVPQAGGFGMMGGGSTVAVGHMSSFYANRLGAMQVPANGMWGMRRFTDPAMSLGGGLRLDVGEHLSLRPDLRVHLVMRNGDTTTVGTFSLGFGYRF